MKKLTGALLSVIACASLANADAVVTQFEAPKASSEFDKVELALHGNLTFTYQVLENDYTPSTGTAVELQAGLILPTADLIINAKILSGFNVKLQTMLSSHHHHETYVKGGEATIDNLDFISEGFLKGFMNDATIRMGVNDINFGDAHFRRNDNAGVFSNPFVNNMAVESYEAAAFIDIFYRIPSVDSFVVVGVTNDQVNPDDVVASEYSSSTPAVYAKIGYDKQLNDALRVRVSQSLFHNSGNGNNSLYNGDKAGTLATSVFGGTGGFGSGWNAMSGYYELTASMTNAFVKYNDTEFFALVEIADGSKTDDSSLSLTHYSADVVQRFSNDRFYVAARYEYATVEKDGDTTDDSLSQVQATVGWFLSKNAMAKVEYIKQERKNWSTYVGDASFDGFMILTALKF
ncbi:MAG: hypothetical protein COB99_00850 [Sulfurimonas sp.]|nr:MAG: hypothetical protein COB99_00850 [Sulfurimonas sp.]